MYPEASTKTDEGECDIAKQGWIYGSWFDAIRSMWGKSTSAFADFFHLCGDLWWCVG